MARSSALTPDAYLAGLDLDAARTEIASATPAEFIARYAAARAR